MAYRVDLTRQAARSYAGFPRDVRERIAEVLDRLEQDPRGHGVKKLTGAELYRVRTGDYRVVFEIDDDALVVVVVRIGNRRDVYRR